MSVSAPLLDNIDENAPRIDEAPTDVYAQKTPASAYFRPLFKILATTTVVISVVNIALLIATYIIIKKAPLGNSYLWYTQKTVKALAILMSAPLVISGINTLINVPILLNVVVDVVLLSCIIPRVVDLIDGLPDSGWCREPYRYPGQPPAPPPDPKCLHWKSVITILMGISAGFTILICVIYAVQLLLRGVAIYRTKFWKRPLSSALPREISIHFSMRVLRQGEESAEGSGHGPIHLS